MNQAKQDGYFITLEGIDGSGTTTQLASIKEFLVAQGRTVHTTCEPSSLPMGRMLRQALTGDLPLASDTMAALFAADRLDHISREILPALDNGDIVVSDRYLMSSLAYQSLEVPMDWVQKLNCRALRPDLTFFFRVSPDVALSRRQKRGAKEERFEANDFQVQVAQRYEEVLVCEGLGEICVIDANRSLKEVTQKLELELATLLSRRHDETRHG
jgi:dTMP kinase